MQLEIRVVGKVQNVWFRASTAAVATDLGLRGFAKNLADGSVEVVAVGEKKDLEKLGKWCERFRFRNFLRRRIGGRERRTSWKKMERR